MWEIAGLDLSSLLICLGTVFLAAIVRGYAGFGFTAIVVISLSFILDPAEIIPVLLLMEIAASIQLLPSILSDVTWQRIRWMSIGIVIGVGPGVYLLSILPSNHIRIILSVFVFIVSCTLLWGVKLTNAAGGLPNFLAGIVSGLMTGATGTGGLAIVSFFVASSVSAKETRANMAILFLSMDTVFIALASTQGLMNSDSFIRAGLFILPLFLGVFVGSLLFERLQIRFFRLMTIALLMTLSSAGLARALLI